jgi:hypothetical protein
MKDMTADVIKAALASCAGCDKIKEKKKQGSALHGKSEAAGGRGTFLYGQGRSSDDK